MTPHNKKPASGATETGETTQMGTQVITLDHTGTEVPDTSADLVPTANLAMLDALDPVAREIAVTGLLDQARTWLATAVQATEPRPAAEFKAFIATVHETTKQLGLSKAIQVDAQEMVRRAERGVGNAIREGREAGTVKSIRDGGPRGDYERNGSVVRVKSDPLRDENKMSTSDFFSNGNEHNQVNAMTDASDEDFEEALSAAKAEDNLSRANVVRKLKGEVKKPTPRPEQMRGTHHPKTARIVEQTALTLSGLVMGLAMVEHGSVSDEVKAEYGDHMKDALRQINTFVRTEMSLR
ncbi:MAG: hypothetical protein NVSMB4_07000 [Acidimicrobiales bacterium]